MLQKIIPKKLLFDFKIEASYLRPFIKLYKPRHLIRPLINFKTNLSFNLVNKVYFYSLMKENLNIVTDTGAIFNFYNTTKLINLLLLIN